jgi:hypothetical protein
MAATVVGVVVAVAEAAAATTEELVAAVIVEAVDAKRAPSAKHTASRTSWLHTRKESRDVPVNFP